MNRMGRGKLFLGKAQIKTYFDELRQSVWGGQDEAANTNEREWAN